VHEDVRIEAGRCRVRSILARIAAGRPADEGDGDRLNIEGKRVGWSSSAVLGDLRGLLHRFANARVRSAAADVARQASLDVGVPGFRIARQERGCRHDLAGLAEAALGAPEIAPRALQRVAAVRGQALEVSPRARGTPDGVTQERTDLPSRWTVQAPHCACPQPPNLFRQTQHVAPTPRAAASSGSTSSSRASPFTST